MPYIKKKFVVKKPTPAFAFLMHELDLSMKEAQRWIDRYRLFVGDEIILDKGEKICGEVEIVIYEPNSKGLLPTFEEEDFAVFEKPSNVLVHPTGRKTVYSLYDEILHLYGKDAHVVHRIDRETSGLIVVAKNKKAEAALKMLFEKRAVQKSYLALVRGEMKEAINVNVPLLLNDDYGTIKLRMVVDEKGKASETDFKPLHYFEDIDATLVEAFPKTGRQHQIRVHLFHVKHPILGDPIYGVTPQDTARYLDEVLSAKERFEIMGSNRLLLHAHSLDFTYKEKSYSYQSTQNIPELFYAFAKEVHEEC